MRLTTTTSSSELTIGCGCARGVQQMKASAMRQMNAKAATRLRQSRLAFVQLRRQLVTQLTVVLAQNISKTNVHTTVKKKKAQHPMISQC